MYIISIMIEIIHQMNLHFDCNRNLYYCQKKGNDIAHYKFCPNIIPDRINTMI